GGAAQAAQVGGAVERHPNRTPVARDGGLHRLADPPDGVRDEFDSPVRIELPGRGHEAEIALADQVHQRNAAVLELLGYGHDEAHVVPSQLLLGKYVPAERLPGKLHLLLAGEEGDPTDLIQVKVQAL